MTPTRAIDSPQPGPDRAAGGEASPDPSSRAVLEHLLAEWIGLDPATLGAAALTRACQRRMEALGLPSLERLHAVVEADPEQRDLLVEEVVVSESWFFRDEPIFAFLETFARTIAAMPGRRPVRILSVPCACGEEPYSVAMRLFDAGLPEESFTIDAFDVSHVCLAKAEAGRYSANAFRNADLGFRRRWFRDEDRRSVIDPAIRGKVRFAWGNLLKPDFARGQAPYDLVFCRNLLIYLTPQARRDAEATLDRLLARDGALIVGAAEPPILRGAWIPAGSSSMFALRRRTPSLTASSTPKEPLPPTEPRVPRAFPTKPPVNLNYKPRVPPSPRSTPPPTNATTGSTNDTAANAALLESIGQLANAGHHTEAIAACESHLREAGPSPELFFMLGTLYQAHGNLDRAEGCFHKTLYLDPRHEEAALALALVAASRGDERMAESYRETASRIFMRKAAR
jgi:chemotaxis protein methyltransferase WspC